MIALQRHQMPLFGASRDSFAISTRNPHRPPKPLCKERMWLDTSNVSSTIPITAFIRCGWRAATLHPTHSAIRERRLVVTGATWARRLPWHKSRVGLALLGSAWAAGTAALGRLERPAADRFRARALCGIWLGVYGFLTRILGASRRFRLALPARSRPQHHQAKKPHSEMLSKNGSNSI